VGAMTVDQAINVESAESDEISQLRDTVRRFAAKECPPEAVAKWDVDDEIPREMARGLAELGLFGLAVPEAYGGLGRHVVALSVVIEELARCSSAIAALYVMGACYGALNIVESGSVEQKERLLPGLLQGEALFCYGLSEPDVGADLANVKTRAERVGDRVIVNGSKRWISGANFADYMYTLVRSGPPEDRRKNLSFLLIPLSAPGVSMEKLPAMGMHGCATHDVELHDVEVPLLDVVGGEAGWNNGWSLLAGAALEVEKLSPSSFALGIAEGAMAEAWAYSQERIQGGKRICGHQAVRHVLSDCQTKLQACRLMVRHAAWLVETNQPSAAATSMTKLFVCETAKEIVLSCQQNVMGAYGYASGFNMERYVRDILAYPIFGGSSAIQRNNIANLLKLPRE
jgi:alkylation response protein AidB-like acyl-CoA dehydrogenase